MKSRLVLLSIAHPRLAFFRAPQAITLPPTGLPFQSGVPTSSGSTLAEHMLAFSLVGNLGNMVHRMAMVQMTKCNRHHSGQVNIFKLISKVGSPQRAAEMLNARFDGVVITLSNIMTAGHVAPTMDPNNSGQKLMRGFRGKNAAYVLQTEHKMLKEFMHVDGVYNEATQTVSKAHMSQAIEKECGVSPPFSEYLSFSDVSAWRQAARRFDLYVGDRIHGGVAAMQVGVPSLVLHADTRVQELTSYHGIPSCPLDEFAEIGAEAAIARYLSPQRIAAFHESYRDALGRFEAATAEAGLQLHNRLQ